MNGSDSLDSNNSVNTSDLTGNIASALSLAQGKISPPHKRKKVDFLDKSGRRVKYSYADLADVIDSIRSALTENELSVTHILGYRSGVEQYGMATRLLHISGEYLETWYPLPDPSVVDIRPQEFGSALTYARRYSLTSLLGIASEEDDDGQEAAPAKTYDAPKNEPKKESVKKADSVTLPAAQAITPISPVIPKVVVNEISSSVHPLDQKPGDRPAKTGSPTQAQLARLFSIATEKGWTKEQVKEFIGKKFSLESTKDLTREQYDQTVASISSDKGFKWALHSSEFEEYRPGADGI